MQFTHPSSTKKQTKMNMAPLIAIVAVCMFGLIYLVLDWVREEIKHQREDKQEIEDYDKVARALDQHEKRNYNPLHPYQGFATPLILTRPLVVKHSSTTQKATKTRPLAGRRSFPTPTASVTRPLGALALKSEAGGFGLNTAVGLEALTKNTTGLGNTAVGAGTTAHGLAPARPTLGSNTTGGFNTAIGTISKMRSEPCERIWKR
jgi:hypothetical protein